MISGFLGAGKTTFIQAMTKKTGRDFVVYENEYGRADVDTKLLETNAELSVWESTENCVCCSGKADFASAVLTISGTLDPEYLIVEPTGVAKLSSLLDNIRKIQYERISLLQSVVIVDASCFLRQKQQYPDIYLDQLCTASTVVCSKTERANPEELEQLQEEILRLNPGAEIICAPYSQLPAAWWNQLLDRPLDTQRLQKSEAQFEESRFESMSLDQIALPSPTQLISFLNALTAGVFGQIPRAKGLLPCGSEWLRFDVVDRSWAITGTEPLEPSQCVFIGSELYRAGLREILIPGWKPAVSTRVVRKKSLFSSSAVIQ